jgi:hypothetical protein
MDCVKNASLFGPKWQEDIAEKEDEAKRIHVANCVDKNGRSVLILNMSMKVIML